MTTPSRPTPIKVGDYTYWTSFWRDAGGAKRTKRFGNIVDVSGRDAERLYQTWLATEWSREEVRNPDGARATYAIADLARDYRAFARTYYVKGGKVTRQIDQVDAAMRALELRHGEEPADSLRAPSLRALVDGMIVSTDQLGKPRFLSAKTVNGRLWVIKAAYRWAHEQGRVGAEALASVLATSRVSPLRSKALPSKAIRAVDDALVEATVACMPPTLAIMVNVQRLTGMRPGEVCAMRPCDIVAPEADGTWLYRPPGHKMEHKGLERVVPLGPRVRAMLRVAMEGLRDVARDEHVFSPRQANEERRELRRRVRKHTLRAGYGPGERVKPVNFKPVRDFYTEESYRKAIHHACRLAKVAQWNPNQLRHSTATLIRDRQGLDVASAVLGHQKMDTTQIYAELRLEKAVEWARQNG